MPATTRRAMDRDETNVVPQTMGWTGGGELLRVVRFALQAAAAETERVAAKVEEGQTTH